MDTPIIADLPRNNLPPKLLRFPRSKRADLPPGEFTPARRLVAAIVLQAVRDAYYPETNCRPEDTASAIRFLESDHGNGMLYALIGKAA